MNVIRHLLKMALASAIMAVCGSSTTGSAATAFVIVGAGNTDTFTPAVTNIAVGDQVVWQWNYTSTFITHSTTSGTNGVPSGLWRSLTNAPPYSFTNTFNASGSYVYYCGIHFNLQHMTGAVVVASASLPPSVAITNPAPGAVFAALATVTVQASASGNGGTVTNVQFLADAGVVANDTTAPYSAVTGSLVAGSHTLSAVASDNNGAKNTNSITIDVVAPVSVLLSAPQPVSPGQFRFSYTANAGLNYIVQSSSNLLSPDWTTLITNTATGSSIDFTDLNATLDNEYYRVGLLPNP